MDAIHRTGRRHRDAAQSGDGRLDFDRDETGNPHYSDDNVHRELSLLVEHRPAPGSDGGPASIWDQTGKRGSLIYTVKNVRRSTPSQLEAYALDALQKAVDEGWILIRPRRRPSRR